MYTLLTAVFPQLDVVRGGEHDHAQTELFHVKRAAASDADFGDCRVEICAWAFGLLIESGSNLVQVAGTRVCGV